MKVRRFGVDVENAGQHFAFLVCFVQAVNGFDLVGRIVVFFQLAQAQSRTVVHGDFDRRARIVFDVDVFEVTARS